MFLVTTFRCYARQRRTAKSESSDKKHDLPFKNARTRPLKRLDTARNNRKIRNDGFYKMKFYDFVPHIIIQLRLFKIYGFTCDTLNI